MNLPGNNHVYDIIPPFYGNEKLNVDDEDPTKRPFKLKLSGVTPGDADAVEKKRSQDAIDNNGSDLVQMIQDDELALFKRHFHGAENLVVGDVEITTADQFLEHAPNDLQAWCKVLIKKTENLIKFEIKN